LQSYQMYPLRSAIDVDIISNSLLKLMESEQGHFSGKRPP